MAVVGREPPPNANVRERLWPELIVYQCGVSRISGDTHLFLLCLGGDGVPFSPLTQGFAIQGQTRLYHRQVERIVNTNCYLYTIY